MSNMAETAICLMGGFRVMHGSGTIPMRPSAERLVARLALKGAQTRQDVAQCLWADSSKATGLSALRTVLTRARLDAPHLVLEEGRLLRLATNNCDAADVHQWAISVLAGQEPESYPRGLGEDLLPAWDDSWLAEEREELRGLQLHALDALGQRLVLSGMLSRAARAAMAAVRIDPLRESATRLLIEVHLRQGNDLDAIKRFRRYEVLLRNEIGLIPGPALRTLIAPVLAARADRPEGSSSRLGRQTTARVSG
jgi:DNA-binding SARP family transcriptional activator